MTLSVLAVDDSRTIREMIRATLTPAGFAVETADNGLFGLEALDQARPDVIITDVNMPRMNGFEFISAVRNIAEHRTTPILVLTTEAAMDLKLKARAAGATGWIVKPFDPEKLVKALQMVAG